MGKCIEGVIHGNITPLLTVQYVLSPDFKVCIEQDTSNLYSGSSSSSSSRLDGNYIIFIS